jgi:hypothetical protein
MGEALHTNREFESWLSRNGSFHDCRVLRLDPYPLEEGCVPPGSATLELAYQIEGNYKAYSQRVSRAFRLSASGIQRYSLPKDGRHFPDHYSEGIDILDDCEAVGFQIDVPALLTVVCSSVDAEELPRLVETVQPWLSDREVYAEVPEATMPLPQTWVDWFEQLGHTVSWHIYGGEPRPPAAVPQGDYKGWFLQAQEDLDRLHQGIFFLSCKPVGSGFSVHIENHGAAPSLWRTAHRILGSFREATIRCGNCEFTSAEWLEETKDGTTTPST